MPKKKIFVVYYLVIIIFVDKMQNSFDESLS